jgi:tetratricopeptide (TPR) repeat protein
MLSIRQFERNEAVRLLRWALSVDDGDPDTLAVAAVISAFMVGDRGSEIEMADRAVALDPKTYLAWRGRGWVYEVAGLPEEAVRSFERAIRMSPIDFRVRDQSGRALVRRNLPESRSSEVSTHPSGSSRRTSVPHRASQQKSEALQMDQVGRPDSRFRATKPSKPYVANFKFM